MADKTQKRLRKARKRRERQRRAALAARNPVRPDRGPGRPGHDIGPQDLFRPAGPMISMAEPAYASRDDRSRVCRPAPCRWTRRSLNTSILWANAERPLDTVRNG
jgi:hypothetical protein